VKERGWEKWSHTRTEPEGLGEFERLTVPLLQFEFVPETLSLREADGEVDRDELGERLKTADEETDCVLDCVTEVDIQYVGEGLGESEGELEDDSEKLCVPEGQLEELCVGANDADGDEE
jgi:hypothetical protein